MSPPEKLPFGEIVEDIDLPAEIQLVRSQRDYDPTVPGDNSGVTFAAVPHEKRQAEHFLRDFMRNAAQLTCPECRGDQFRIFADDHDDQPLILIVCHNTRCGATWKPMKIQVAQMTSQIARNLGLWVPD